MKAFKVYPQESKLEIIGRFRQSGLSKKKFCELPEVPITVVTLRKWLERDKALRWGEAGMETKDPAPSALNIVCYNIGKQSGHGDGNEEEPSLQEMVAFQQEVRNLCIRLYRLGCSKGSIMLLGRIKAVLS